MFQRLTDSPNARSKSITTAELDTHGILNRHSQNHPSYQVGVTEDRGTRRTMEDAHSFVVDFDAVRGQGFFAVFDGHAGKHAAEWCGAHFHECLLSALHENPTTPIPDILNKTFHTVDSHLSRMCEESDGKIHSGCTAVTAFLRVEDADGYQSFLPKPSSPTSESPTSGSSVENDDPSSPTAAAASSESVDGSMPSANGTEDPKMVKKDKEPKKSSGSRIRNALRSLGGGSSSKHRASSAPSTPRSQSPTSVRKGTAEGTTFFVPPSDARRVLYSANAGDARAVLSRGGKAVRLTYDHKGSDKQEAKRITDAGGFVMSGRVNGVLAVTRSLGDSSMKEFVVGSPYTTETQLCEEDEFLIIACDGLWDIVSDQNAIELVRGIEDAQAASEALLKHALNQHTTDNVTVIVVRFKHGTYTA
ncbi:phosphatase 2C-domain-containing protein [Cyathus striatus]|nr:phosphatase 2C-domain-containing protein [Cyathus striatus]